jgi:hypothetical protein
MKRALLAVSFFLVILSVQAQNEGAAVAMDRFERNNSIFFSAGPSFTFGKNLGDYSNGLSLELGYLKRLNRLFSVGPAISYINFKYDKDKTYPFYYSEPDNTFYELYFEGGDARLISLGLSFKLNFIPVSDNSKFSFYGLVTPFVCSATKTEATANGFFYYNDGNSYVKTPFPEDLTSDDVDSFKKKSNVTGGAHIGFGLEFMPAKPVSFFAQATFSYTMPVNFVSSQEYIEKAEKDGEYWFFESDPDTYYYDTTATLEKEKFPNVKKGFSAVNIRVGVTFNF